MHAHPIAPHPLPVVAYQGEPGAFSEEAIRLHFGDQAVPLPCPTFEAALLAVLAGWPPDDGAPTAKGPPAAGPSTGAPTQRGPSAAGPSTEAPVAEHPWAAGRSDTDPVSATRPAASPAAEWPPSPAADFAVIPVLNSGAGPVISAIEALARVGVVAVPSAPAATSGRSAADGHVGDEATAAGDPRGGARQTRAPAGLSDPAATPPSAPPSAGPSDPAATPPSALPSAPGSSPISPQAETVARIVLPLRQMLLAPAGATLQGLREVRSHPVALAQCARFLEAHPHLHPVAVPDTAGAAREVAALGDPGVGALASARAGEAHGLVVVRPDVHDDPRNRTTFLLVRRHVPTD